MSSDRDDAVAALDERQIGVALGRAGGQKTACRQLAATRASLPSFEPGLLALAMLLVVSVLFGASCGGGDGQCDPAPKSDPLEVGESQTIGVEFVDGGWGLVDASGVYWSADFAAPEGAPANGVLSATVQLIDAQIEDDGDIERATLSVDLGEFGTVVLAGPVSCN